MEYYVLSGKKNILMRELLCNFVHNLSISNAQLTAVQMKKPRGELHCKLTTSH